MHKKFLNHIDLYNQPEGDDRRKEMQDELLSGATFIPKTVLYEDIDNAFKDWVEHIEISDNEGTLFPTMTLYSNQRFSEYTQSWRYVDENKNLLLNFKSVTRQNNPEYGKIHDGLWNIPGDRFYIIKKKVVLDDNGTESMQVIKMRVPTAVDMIYKLSIFTTHFSKLNEFNTEVVKLFAARQAYVCPNGHYMPMTLENVSDESQYNIDDRQYYSQTFQIKLNGYCITKDDYRVEEHPIKVGVNVKAFGVERSRGDVEIEEMEYIPIDTLDECGNVIQIIASIPTGKKIPPKQDDSEESEELYFRPVVLKIKFPPSISKVKINDGAIGYDIIVTDVVYENAIGGKIKSDKDEFFMSVPFKIKNNDRTLITIGKRNIQNAASVTFYGYDPNFVVKAEAEALNSEYQTIEGTDNT